MIQEKTEQLIEELVDTAARLVDQQHATWKRPGYTPSSNAGILQEANALQVKLWEQQRDVAASYTTGMQRQEGFSTLLNSYAIGRHTSMKEHAEQYEPNEIRRYELLTAEIKNGRFRLWPPDRFVLVNL